jgi:hypothetical protein
MRYQVTKRFEQFVVSQGILIETVAVVGGTSTDPEVGSIANLYPEAKFHFFNISNSCNDPNFHFLDINESPPKIDDLKFDLVLSSQVIEHIWNHKNYFEILVKFTKPSGLIWVNCPKSNMVHGSPNYFSAGFTASYLSQNLEHLGCEILVATELGNKRYYLGIHLSRYWQTREENEHPLWNYNFQPGSYLGVARKFLNDLPSRLFLSLVSRKDSVGKDFATESFVGARIGAHHFTGKLD